MSNGDRVVTLPKDSMTYASGPSVRIASDW